MKYARIAVLSLVLAACSEVDKSNITNPTVSVPTSSVPTLGAGKNIRRTGLPKNYPGPTRTDLVVGSRNLDGSCEFESKINKIPGLFVVYTEVDNDNCKAIVAQLDWAERLKADHVGGDVNNILTTSTNSTVAALVLDCNPPGGIWTQTRESKVTYAFWTYAGGALIDHILDLQDNAWNNIASIQLGSNADCIWHQDTFSGSAASVTTDGANAGWSKISNGSTFLTPKDCGSYLCYNQHAFWAQFKQVCSPSVNAIMNVGTSSVPNKLYVHSEPIGPASVWENADVISPTTGTGTPVDPCGFGIGHVWSASNAEGSWHQ